MNSSQLIKIVKSFENKNYDFLGVFLNDDASILKNLWRDNCFFIVNTITLNEIDNMGHWVLFFVRNSTLNLICSYSIPAEIHSGVIHKYFMLSPYKTKFFLRKPLQSSDSLMCGGYVLFFAHHLCENIPMQQIMQKFSPNLKKNDVFIDNFIKKKYLKEMCRIDLCPARMFNSVCSKQCKCIT